MQIGFQYAVVFLSLCAASVARATTLTVGADDLPLLQQLAPAGKVNPDAIELEATRQQLEAAPDAWKALRSWTRAGGLVVLHGDAAQLFGYETMAARPGKPEQGGLLFGRGRPGGPIGSNPLLTGSTSFSPWGVEKVFYRLQPGDHLATGHATALPLLRALDMQWEHLFKVMPTNPSFPSLPETLGGGRTYRQMTLKRTPAYSGYAAALAPFGHGWALFTPRLIETHRADGPLFHENLTEFIRQRGPGARNKSSALLGLPGEFIARATQDIYKQLSQGKSARDPDDFPRLSDERLAELRRVCAYALNPASAGATAVPGSMEQRWDQSAPLLLTRGEIAAASAALQDTPDDATRTRLTALLMLWRARLAWQIGDEPLALGWLGYATRLAPQAGDVAWWQATITSYHGIDLLRSAPDQAATLRIAAAGWQRALTQEPLLYVSEEPQAEENASSKTPDGELANSSVAGAVKETSSKLTSRVAPVEGAEASVKSRLPKRLVELALSWTHAAQKRDALLALMPPNTVVKETWDGGAKSPLVIRYPRDPQTGDFPDFFTATFVNSYAGVFFLLNDVDAEVRATLPGVNLKFWAHPAGAPSSAKTAAYSGTFSSAGTSHTKGPGPNFLLDAPDLGWGADIQELLIFATPQDYLAYRNALGETKQSVLLYGRGWFAESVNAAIKAQTGKDSSFLPKADFAIGDTIGQQMLAVRTILPPESRGGDPLMQMLFMPRDTPRGSTQWPDVARMQGQVLVNSLAEGGTPPPLWMEWGISALSWHGITSGWFHTVGGRKLETVFFLDEWFFWGEDGERQRAGDLYSPYTYRQREALWFTRRLSSKFPSKARIRLTPERSPDGAWELLHRHGGGYGLEKWDGSVQGLMAAPGTDNRDLRFRLVQAQAQRMMRYFYFKFGPGAVIETLQRLGSGQSVDDALRATTGLTESQFHTTWYYAEGLDKPWLSLPFKGVPVTNGGDAAKPDTAKPDAARPPAKPQSEAIARAVNG